MTAMTLDEAMKGLRGKMVRMVRTSTDAVNRRMHQRVTVDLPGKLTLPGRAAIDVRLVDLSAGGAKIEGVSELPVGTAGQLSFEGISANITVRRMSARDQSAGVAFSNGEALRGQLARWLDTAKQARSAA